MKKFIYALLIAPVLLMSCGESFKKGGNVEYKIVKDGKGDIMKYGSFFEFSFKQVYKDSVMANSNDYSNQLAALDSNSIPANIFKIFSQCRKGDSVVLKMKTDSMYFDPRSGQLNLPPGIKKGQYVLTCYKVQNVYATREEADSVYKILTEQAKVKAKLKEKETLAKDDKTIKEYLDKNKITAEKGVEGTYVQILTPGTGNKIDTSVQVKVNYTGKTLSNLSGKAFDSNTDPAFQHVEPYPVNIWAPEVVKGWVDGLRLLNKGAKAKFYIPSGLGYGPQGNGGDIKPNDILVFDIEVVDVISKDIAMIEMKKQQKIAEEQNRKMMEMQQRQQDSMRRAAAMDTLKKK
jgi:FKBP-type peptidyl-prolyl cis-trans isomerase FkpA